MDKKETWIHRVQYQRTDNDIIGCFWLLTLGLVEYVEFAFVDIYRSVTLYYSVTLSLLHICKLKLDFVKWETQKSSCIKKNNKLIVFLHSESCYISYVWMSFWNPYSLRYLNLRHSLLFSHSAMTEVFWADCF